MVAPASTVLNAKGNHEKEFTDNFCNSCAFFLSSR